jgi:hypothetical protein
MVKVVIITGSHRRHAWFTAGIAERFDIVGVVAMPREGSVPQAPQGTSARDRAHFDRHFRLRDEAEERVFGDAGHVLDALPTLRIARDGLNAPSVAAFVRDRGAEACIVFGADILREPLLSALPALTLNVHLGLSPWYRGTATLFWPFHNLEPHWAGATLHRITPDVDAGPILLTCAPPLHAGDGIHDVAVRTVEVAHRGVIACLERVDRGGTLVEHPQRTAGRLYLTRHFRPEHLRVNYELFDDRMVDAHLAGEIGSNPLPALIGLEG